MFVTHFYFTYEIEHYEIINAGLNK